MERSELEHYCSTVVDCVAQHLTKFEVRLLWKANLDLLAANLDRHAARSMNREREASIETRDEMDDIARLRFAIDHLYQYFRNQKRPTEEERLTAEIFAEHLGDRLPKLICDD